MATETIRIQVKPDANTVIVTGSTLTGVENIGGAQEIYKGTTTGGTAQLRTLSGGTGANVVVSGDTILIESSAAGDFVSTDTFTGYTATTETRLQGIESDVSGNTSSIADNAADIVYLSGETSGNTANISQLRIDVDAVSGQTDTNTTDIATLTGDVATISGDTAQLRIDVDAVSGQTDTNTTDIATLTGETAQLRIDVDANSGATIQNASDIQIVSGATETNATDITALETKTQHQTGLAQETVFNSNFKVKNTTGSGNSNLRIENLNPVSGKAELSFGDASSVIKGQIAYEESSDNLVINKQNASDIVIEGTSWDGLTNQVSGNTTAIAGKVDVSGDTMTGNLSVPQIEFQTGATQSGHTVGSVHWNEVDGTTERHLKHDVTLQDGQENLVFGVAYEDLTDGDAVAIYGFTSGGTPIIGKADIPLFGTEFYTGNDIGVMTSSALSGGTCYATVFGKVRGLDTSAYSAQTTLWLSNTVRGALTNVEPVYPEQKIPIAFVAKQDLTEGELIVNPTLDLSPELNNIEYFDEWFTGTFIDKITMNVTSSGGTNYLNIENSASGETEFSILWGTDDVVTYSAQTIALDNGTDTVPVLNYISMNYTAIQNNSQYFTGNRLDTNGEFCPVATVLAQSASGVTANEPYKVHGWIDRMETDGRNRGGASRITERLRKDHAAWDNGVLPTLTFVAGTPNRLEIATTEGIIFQANRNYFPSFTTSGDTNPVYWYNQELQPYEKLTNLGEVDTLADGTAFGNSDWASLVVWGCSSQNSDECKLFVNAPTGDYNTEDGALQDALNYAVYTIPDSMRGTGFLICRVLARYSSAGEIQELGEVVDLRGVTPDSAGGGVIGGGGAIAVKNSLEQDVDSSYQLVNDVTGSTTAQYYGFDSGGTRGYHEFDKSISIDTLTGNTTLAQSDNGKMLEANGTFTITFPSGLTEGWNVSITNVGAGTITYAAGTGATIQSKDSNVTTASQYAGIVAYQRPTANTIILVGDLE